jgi:hypothetical protein
MGKFELIINNNNNNTDEAIMYDRVGTGPEFSDRSGPAGDRPV